MPSHPRRQPKIPSEAAVALWQQAGAIRRAATKLEELALQKDINAMVEGPQATSGQRLIRVKLGEMQATLDALFARFGKADR